MLDTLSAEFISRSLANSMRQRIRYSIGVRPRISLKRRANADRDILATRAKASTVQRSAGCAWMALITLLRFRSATAENQPPSAALIVDMWGA